MNRKQKLQSAIDEDFKDRLRTGWKYKNPLQVTAEHGDPLEEGLNEVMDSYSQRSYYNVFVKMLE